MIRTTYHPIYDAVGMITMPFLVGIIGATAGKPEKHARSATGAMIAFICLNVACFAATWGPAAWIVVGEMFPFPIHSRGVGLSTSSNWSWNCVSPPKPHHFLRQKTNCLSDHCHHYPIPRRHRQRRGRPRFQHLHVGRSLLFSPRLRLLPCP